MKAYSFEEYRKKHLEEIKTMINNKEEEIRVYTLIKYYLKRYENLKGQSHPNLKASQWDKVIESFLILYVKEKDYPTQYNKEREIKIDKDYIDQYFEDFENSNKTDHNILHFINKKIILYRGYNAGKIP